MVYTVDTDVLVFLIGKFYELVTLYPAADIWVAFGTSRNFTLLHVNAIWHALKTDKSMSLGNVHGKPGMHTTKWLKHLSSWHCTLTAIWTWNHVTSIFWNTSALSSVTRVIIWTVLTRHGESYFAKGIRPWKLFHQHRMLCCSTQSV